MIVLKIQKRSTDIHT